MGATLYGEWDRVKSKLQTLPSDLKDAYEKGTRESGDYVVNKMQGHIYNQDLGWTPLKDKTIKEKGSSKILIETGSLASSIKAKVISPTRVFIGAEGSNPSGESNANILKYHEFGTTRISPRPLVRPTFEETKPKIQEILKNALKDAIRK